MEISELTLKLIILLIPGVIATIIVEQLTIHKEWSPFRFVLNSIVLGVISYLCLQLCIDAVNHIAAFCRRTTCVYKYNLHIWNTLEDTKSLPYIDVFYSSLFAIPIGLACTFITHYNLIHWFGRKIKITNKFGDRNLFSKFLDDDETSFVQVRCVATNLAYFGHVHRFSETEKVSEIQLGPVKVYSHDKHEFLYDLEDIYLSFSKTDIIIEKVYLNINHGTETQSTEQTSSNIEGNKIDGTQGSEDNRNEERSGETANRH